MCSSDLVMSKPVMKRAIKSIKDELVVWEEELIKQGKIVEAQRLHQRTMYDLEMMKEMGFCRGIENYSRHLTGKPPGAPPPTLFDYLPSDALLVIDESHQSIPQIGAMFKGDQSRKLGSETPSTVSSLALRGLANWPAIRPTFTTGRPPE